MNNNEYNLYKKDDDLYKNSTSNLFFYQKYKDDPWNKGENFGDYLSKVIVGEIAQKYDLRNMKRSKSKLLAIGSILHFAKTDDIIWGSGINGKIPLSRLNFDTLDIKAIRGPLTKEILEKRGIYCPEVFGDPALLLPNLFPELKYKPIKNKIIVIPNLNEYEACTKIIPKMYTLISPLKHWSHVINEILSSEIVLTSSLHGLIISEAFNVPVKLFKPFGGETMFKYEDYLEGTNRKLNKDLKSFNRTSLINDGISFKQLHFDFNKLMNSFPKTIYQHN